MGFHDVELRLFDRETVEVVPLRFEIEGPVDHLKQANRLHHVSHYENRILACRFGKPVEDHDPGLQQFVQVVGVFLVQGNVLEGQLVDLPDDDEEVLFVDFGDGVAGDDQVGRVVLSDI